MAQRHLFQKGQIPWNKGHGIQKKCKECDRSFVVRPCRKKTAQYCSKSCAGKHRTNLAVYQKRKWATKLANGYIPKSSLDYRERRRFKHQIQKQVFERDNYTCQLCQQRGGDLQVDHIQSWADYIELRFNMDNCRTLCVSCHYQITFNKPMPENIQGWGHNFKKAGVDL